MGRRIGTAITVLRFAIARTDDVTNDDGFRLLFDQAYTMRPAIIFFDEIDGLAPVRSSRQDQIHSSIVSTLLALMDGLDSRGEVGINRLGVGDCI